jgi:predicted nucleotide-binding protein (sugar kinase/HSP70/actin superfamily)
MLSVEAGSKNGRRARPLEGKKVYIPPMAYGSGRAFASAFRALGVDADIVPPADDRTRELGARHTSGDECYPAKVTVGDFMKLLEQPDVDPEKVLLFMPTADGPCRFGQYAPYLKQVLASNGYDQTEILSPTSNNSYQGLGETAGAFIRTAWRALLAADLLQKMLLLYRPHEVQKGSVDAVYHAALDDLCSTIETSTTKPPAQLRAIHDSLVRCVGRFRAVGIRRDSSMPLIGVVGEIFCRLHTFSNDDLVRRLEEYGGQAWLSDLTEWVWYTNTENFRKLKLNGRLIS